ncbi:phage holin family protein [Glycomyces sp. TRM65418]|uniref:phage holin family protein n=1 Tax=Glycomyces sp. TRM65418 TaxID=2867006 RepID=UPI001CE5C453|nr:phage holin family protein [Glycomyces sp. TRM65418]MCC3762045.1 phage holin family protein [Glycomyces sp. TRM65418]QZD56116.1 phage holin family protein [Glycomyces sp. TRM65418]
MEVRHDPEARAMREAEREHRGEWADADHDTREWSDRGRKRGWTGGRGRHDWDDQDRSVGAIVGDLTSQVAHLARVEAQLAAREVADKAKKGAAGGGMFAVAGVMAVYGGAAFAGAALLALALMMPAWASALIVGAALFIIAGIMALIGRSMLRRAMPPVPEETMEHARDDARALQGRMDR